MKFTSPLVPLLAALCAFLPGSPSAQDREPEASPPAARTVILVRHAEKDAAAKDTRDPPLSEAGSARARELSRLLGASGASHLYTSELRRTRDTLAPLSARLGVANEAVPAAKPEALVALLDGLPAGSVAVACGHSNTIPRVAELLGAKLPGLVESQGLAMLADDAYDRVFVITRPATGPAACVELLYGAPCGATSSPGK